MHPLKDTVEHFSNTISTIARSQGYATYFLEFGPPALRQTSTAAVYTSVATSDIRNSNCDNVAGGWAYTFGQDSFEMKGKDEFINNGSGNGICTLGPITTLSYQYPTPAQKTNEFLGCLPKCAYDEINRISWIAKDEDGRTVIEYSWHTPGKQIISYVKLIVEDLKNNNHPAALSYYYEIITLK